MAVLEGMRKAARDGDTSTLLHLIQSSPELVNVPNPDYYNVWLEESKGRVHNEENNKEKSHRDEQAIKWEIKRERRREGLREEEIGTSGQVDKREGWRVDGRKRDKKGNREAKRGKERKGREFW